MSSRQPERSGSSQPIFPVPTRWQMPSAVWGRSFAPKLKNSAVCAISSAAGAEEAEGNSGGGKWASRRAGPRYGADLVVELHFLLGHDFLRDALDSLDLKIESLLEAGERDHDLGLHLNLQLHHIGGGFEDGAGLHLGNLRAGDAEAAAAVAEHRVELVEGGDTGMHFSLVVPSFFNSKACASSCRDRTGG